jgi:hypothetical protein
MLPDPGRYEERYRLAPRGAGLTATLITLGLAFLSVSPWLTAALIAAGIVITTCLAVAGRRTIAFRADYAGITLGVPPGLRSPRAQPVSIPWADAEKIILYRAQSGGRGSQDGVPCIGVQRREGAAPLPGGDEQAPGCPVPGVAGGASRRITGWRLDRERLAAVMAAVAPGVPIVDASTGPGLGAGGQAQIGGRSQEDRTPERGPTE